MTTFILCPTASWPATTSPYRTPRVMLEQGMVRAYTEREDGTTRHLDLAPLGSTRRDTAEWINEQMEDGMSVKALSRDLHISVATVRRFLLSLELTEEIEAGDWDALTFTETGEPVWADQDNGCGEEACVVHGSGGEIAADQPCSLLECSCAANLLGTPGWHTAGCPLATPAPTTACEADGTTADDLVADLEASLAARGVFA